MRNIKLKFFENLKVASAAAHFFQETFQETKKPYLSALLVVLLFLLGVVHWTLFFNYGRMSFKAYDWPKEHMYYSVIRESIKKGIVPYHVSKSFHGTDRFLALPETLLSPQVLLLPLMSIGRFVMFNTLLLYSIGAFGCIMIKKRYRLSLIPFSVLFLLFNFNGYITSHIAVGHSMWNAYFLLPFFCLFIFEVLDEHKPPSTSIRLSLTLFAILLQGGFHIFVWCSMFLLLLGLFNREHLEWVIKTIALSALLSLFRLLPAIITPIHETPLFFSGYPTIRDIFDALTAIRGDGYPWVGGIFGVLHWWEYDIYIGGIGFSIILYFGVCLRFSNDKIIGDSKYTALDLPILVLSSLSLSYFYAFIVSIPVPLLQSERVSTRFIIIPLLMLIVISCIRMQKLGHFNKSSKLRWLSLAAILQMLFSLATHSYVWGIQRLEQSFNSQAIDFSISVISKEDGLYNVSVKFSVFISTFVFFVLLCSKLKYYRND